MTDSSLTDHYDADVKTAQDYYPFGMVMPGRMFTAISIPGGSVSGQSQVNGYTLPVDLDLTSRGSADPKEYVATRMVDLDNGFESGNGDDLTVYIADTAYAGTGNGDGGLAGNGKYRYGFNGQEKVDEIACIGNHTTAEFWEYDPRIGRRWNIDPKPNVSFSPYSVFKDNPIWHTDIKGDSAGPAPAPVKVGSMDYYGQRAQDFMKRNPGKPVPTYYLGYGNVYINKFKKETNQKLSPQGKEWLDKALVNLQQAIENKLVISNKAEDKVLENDNSKFTDFAFDTHVKSYEDAGVLSLPVMDKVNILLTPKPEDLFSDRGLKQAEQIGDKSLTLMKT